MAPTTTTTNKRKPPSFPHLPEQRAKKLKREWVEKQKIKSKWKAQKRKEGIVTARDAASSSTHKTPEDVQSADADTDMEDASADGDEGSEAGDASEGEASTEGDASTDDDDLDDGVERDSEGLSIRSLSPPRTHPRDQPPPTAEDEETMTLRELQRLAYSRSSLHHFKSDPLHRSRGRGGSSARGRGGSSRGGERGRGRGRGAERGGGRGRARGGGQPDMRLRMNALLQQVKQKFEDI